MKKIFLLCLFISLSFSKEVCYSFDKDMYAVSQKNGDIIFLKQSFKINSSEVSISKEGFCAEETKYLFFEEQEKAIAYQKEAINLNKYSLSEHVEYLLIVPIALLLFAVFFG